MVFYGSRATTTKEGRVSNVTCPNCETQTAMDYAFFGKYAHIYWIPLFPIGKESVAECSHCKQTFKVKELPEQIKSKIELEKPSGFPIWYFSGLALIAVLIFGGMYMSKLHDEDVAKYINDPQVGDIYTIEGERTGYHFTMRIQEVTTDSVFALVSDYEYDTTNLKDLDKDENYSDVVSSFSKEDILTLFAEETIEDINRD